MKTAKSGDTVSLTSGTYSDVNIKSVQIAGNVTIKSLDPSKPAVFTDLLLRDSKGLTFSNLEFAVAPTKPSFGFNVNSSSNIALDHLNVHGSMNGAPGDDGMALQIRNSDHVSVTNSEFQQVWHGVSYLDSNHVTISNNKFHDIAVDAVRGGGTSNLTISNNYFTDFYRLTEDHADAIQLWTTNTTKSATNITITDNVINRGAGTQIQGIFLRDETDHLPFQHVTITNNTVIGMSYNGIAVSGATGVSVANNTVLGGTDSTSWIRVQNATGASVTNNLSTAYNYIDADPTHSGNVLLKAASASVANTLTSWLASHANTAHLADAIDPVINRTATLMGYADDPGSSASNYDFKETALTGTANADKLVVGAVGDYRLDAGAGDDTLTGGGAGTTTMLGGAGDDVYNVKNAGDVVVEKAGEGSDTVNASISYTLTDNVETLRMMTGGLTGTGNDLDNRIIGSAGDDTLFGQGGNDVIQGGTGNDVIHGGAGNDILKGEDGNDTLYGDDGDDQIYGGAGNDTIHLGSGTNIAEGGAGADTIYGGTGADTFRFRQADFTSDVAGSMDTISGFTAHKDLISLNLIDANSKTAADDKFAFIGSSGFHKVAGELRFELDHSGGSYVMGDTNGDGVADFKIHVLGVTSFTAADFQL